MKRNIIRSLAVSTLLIAASLQIASAADIPLKAPPVAPPPARNWTGCYVGAGGGYGMWSQDEQTFLLSGAPDSFVSAASGRGWIATVQGGCDYQFNGGPFGNGVVIGAFADYNWSDIHGSNNISVATFPFNGNEKMSGYWAVGGRLGYLPMDRLLVYVSGGYTQAKFDAYNLGFNIVGAPAGVFGINSHTRSGGFIGSGYEYYLGWLPGLTWKTEYRFAKYGSADDTLFLLPANVPFERLTSTKYVQAVTSELVWHFNWSGAH
jgi:outer membrane immunogenic protein